jgi:hypothetical protein
MQIPMASSCIKPDRRWKKREGRKTEFSKMIKLHSSHSEREGEAPTALLAEGAT